MYIYKIEKIGDSDEGFLLRESEYVCSNKEYSKNEFEKMCKKAEEDLFCKNPKNIKDKLIELFNFESIDKYVKFSYYNNEYENEENNEEGKYNTVE